MLLRPAVAPSPPPVSDDLRAVLEQLLRPGAPPSPVLDRLLADYVRFHLVLVVVGGAFAVGALALAVGGARRYRRARRAGVPVTAFPALTHLATVASGVVVGVLLSLVVVANSSTTLDPRPGFAGAVDAIGTAAPGTTLAEHDRAYADWLRSGRREVPEAVARAVDDRLAWQRPKAVVAGVLLLLVLVVGARTWRCALRRWRADPGRWPPAQVARVALGLATVPVALVLVLMVMGNTQASLAPVSMTLFYG